MEKSLEELTLADVSVDVDSAQMRLEDAAAAMTMLGDVLEDEGLQPNHNIDQVKAVAFVRRLPMFLSTFNIILREAYAVAADLEGISSRARDAYRAQKEVKA